MKTRIWLSLLALYIAWGSTYLAIHFAVETIPPFFMAGARFLAAGLVVYTWRRLAGDPAPTRRQWRSAALAGLFLLVGGNGGVSWAEQRVASGIAALIVAAVPLWVVLLEGLRPGGSRPTGQTAAGVLVGLAGILLLVGPTNAPGGLPALDFLGVAALLLAGLSWAAGSLYGREADMPQSALLGAGMEMLAGSGGLFLTGLLAGEAGRLDLAAISLRSLAGLGYLVVAGSLVGFVAYTWLLRVAPTSLVMTYAYVNPLVAVFLGSLLAREALTGQVLIAMPVILSAVVLIQTARRVKDSSPAPARLAVSAAGEDPVCSPAC